MKRLRLAALPVVFAPLVLLLPASPAATQSDEVVITAKRILDVVSGRVLTDHLVRIDGHTFTALERRKPSDKITYDLGDVTLLPGLIDCHTHLTGGEEQTPEGRLIESTARAAVEGVVNAKKTLHAGFTLVRDLGSRDLVDVALRDAIAEGRVPGPRMRVAVKGLSSTGGHGDLNQLPFDIFVQRYSAIADGPDEIRKKVRENVKHGADWIKILVTGGVMSAGTDPYATDYTEEEIRAAVETARSKGRDVAAHAHGAEGILRAVKNGVRSVEHASMLSNEALEAVKSAGVFLVPNPYTNAYMLERGRAGGYQDYQLAKSEDVLASKLESLARAIHAGVEIAYGTDAGVQAHGINGRQFALYVEAGMKPLQAIRSATLVAARLLRIEYRHGAIGPGYAADLVAVRGNPLEDIRVMQEPVFVMKDGRIVVGPPAAAAKP